MPGSPSRSAGHSGRARHPLRPLATEEPEFGNWADPSPADPFRHNTATADPTQPSRDEPNDPPERHFVEPSTWEEDEGADLFDATVGDDPAPGGDPFERLGVSPPLPARNVDPAAGAEPLTHPDPIADLAPITEPTPGSDLFAAAMPNDPAVEVSGNPFGPVDPTPIAIREPNRQPAGAAAVVAAPPPPPEAVDPLTGEPDEAAYSRWLKDWLAYAEQYGDERRTTPPASDGPRWPQ
ncbi:MAG: hypothetical protein P8J50_09365 [Acidimicrobiales bacterium]|nr:hypothetical protein [Acidimicrobiales bacterium]